MTSAAGRSGRTAARRALLASASVCLALGLSAQVRAADSPAPDPQAVIPQAVTPQAVTPQALGLTPTDPRGIADPQALAPFFQALDDVKSGKRTRPVHIIQLGDSHTAADTISGALRARLQAQFGEGGRGALPPGRPFAAYNPRQITVEQSDGWRLEASFLPSSWAKATPGKPVDPAAPVSAKGPYGLSGWRLVSTRAGATVTLKADPEARFDRATICAMASPQSGGLTVTAGDSVRTLALNTEPGAVCRDFVFAGLQTKLELRSEAAPATLLSFATFRSGGVVVSNLGVIGTQVRDFSARDDRIVAAELKAYEPDLIILAFGTNDGFEPGVDGRAYEGVMRAELQKLKRLAPGVPILVMGPPDADTVRPDIPEDGKANFGFACSALSPSEVAGYAKLVTDKSPDLARWYPPPALQVVREAQGRAAVAEGAAFWDWSARMGGACSAHALSKLEPRLVRGDHVHFTSDGGRLVADLLSSDLMQAYRAAVRQTEGQR
jgi:lysophospholipase L1-like esterase